MRRFVLLDSRAGLQASIGSEKIKNKPLATMTQRTCPICKAPFHGRADKKYCSDQCRSTGNNKIRINSAPLFSKINSQLLVNRKILRKLCPAGKTIVPRSLLAEKGFNFHTFSSLYISSERKMFFICYDMAFTPIITNGTQHAMIAPWTEYRTSWNPWNLLDDVEKSGG